MPSLLMCIPGGFMAVFPSAAPCGRWAWGGARRQLAGPGDERGAWPGPGLAVQGRIISCCRNPLDTPSPRVLMFETGKTKPDELVLLEAIMKLQRGGCLSWIVWRLEDWLSSEALHFL